jgi:putative CocE/NonD family hydrolase
MTTLAKVYYYVMGADTEGAPGNEWRTADTWPPFEAAPTPYYLSANGALSTDAPRAESASLSFDFDPSNPVPTRGGANLYLPAGPLDQRPVSSTRKDVLPFATAPLDVPMEITGRVTARLFVSSDAPDTDFTAKLVDIYPAGDERQILMLDGIRRVKSRLGYDKVAPPLSGADEIIELEIDLQSVSWVIASGHRIGLHVSSSNYPRFDVNPNTGEDFAGDAGKRIAHNTVFMDASRTSSVILPLGPVSDR